MGLQMLWRSLPSYMCLGTSHYSISYLLNSLKSMAQATWKPTTSWSDQSQKKKSRNQTKGKPCRLRKWMAPKWHTVRWKILASDSNDYNWLLILLMIHEKTGLNEFFIRWRGISNTNDTLRKDYEWWRNWGTQFLQLLGPFLLGLGIYQ